jgi:hypothetical protein
MQLHDPRTGTLGTPRCQACTAPASPLLRYQAQLRPCQARGLGRRRERGRADAREGVVPKLKRVCVSQVPPTLAPSWSAGSDTKETALGRRRLLRDAEPKARGAQHVCAYLRKAPGCARRRRGRSRNFPTHLSTLPITLACSPGPCPPLCTSAAGPPREARRPAAAATSQRSYLPGKFPAPRRSFPTPRAGPRGAAGSALRGCLCSARLPQLPPRALRSGPSPCLARPTPGPHWQRESPPLRVFPKAPSSRAPAGPRLPRPSPSARPELPRLLGTAGARRANFPRGAGAVPACLPFFSMRGVCGRPPTVPGPGGFP